MIYVYAVIVLTALGGLLAALLLLAERFLANYGPCEITVNDRKPFVVQGGRALLEAFYEQRIFIPSACGGKGTCGYCKVSVVRGGGPLLPTELPYVSPGERLSGVRLACQVKVKQDIVLAVRQDYLDVREFRARVAQARMVTHDTREIQLDLLAGRRVDFRPGQYVQVRVPARQTVFRAYSISSPPGDGGRIELLVRLVPGGLGSTYLHALAVGDEVAFTGPYGEFVLDDDPRSEIICVGGGCGMAPMRSILRHLARGDRDRRCWLFVGAKTAADAMYLAEFADLARQMPNLRVHYALSEPRRSEGWTGETGFVHLCVDRHLPSGNGWPRQAFLCGPAAMIEGTRGVLREKQIAPERIYSDEF